MHCEVLLKVTSSLSREATFGLCGLDHRFTPTTAYVVSNVGIGKSQLAADLVRGQISTGDEPSDGSGADAEHGSGVLSVSIWEPSSKGVTGHGSSVRGNDRQVLDCDDLGLHIRPGDSLRSRASGCSPGRSGLIAPRSPTRAVDIAREHFEIRPWRCRLDQVVEDLRLGRMPRPRCIEGRSK